MTDDALPICEFCRVRPVREAQTDGIWAGSFYCNGCLARPHWLPQPSFLVARHMGEGQPPELYGPDGPLTPDEFAEFWASRHP